MPNPAAARRRLLAYHNDPAIKQRYLDRVAAHRAADQLVQGYRYWQDGKGCAVGCTVHSGDHMAYETELGIPVMLARLEDAIFEGLPTGAARAWPERFLSAIAPGTDLSCVGWRFLHWLLTDAAANPGINHSLVCEAVRRCADVLAPLCDGRLADASAARSAAWSAESAAASAASAARSAAWSAESAESAARSAASAAYVAMADKLIALISEVCPVFRALTGEVA